MEVVVDTGTAVVTKENADSSNETLIAIGPAGKRSAGLFSNAAALAFVRPKPEE